MKGQMQASLADLWLKHQLLGTALLLSYPICGCSVSEGNNPGQGLNTTTERLAQQTTRPQSRGTSHICGLEDPGRKASITRLGGYMEDLGVCS